MKVLVSLIIVNYNGQRYLKRLLNSINNQSYGNKEIILVDNESIDNSIKYVKRYFPEVRLINSLNKGYGFACNMGAKIARGKFLVFLNEDMYLPTNFIEIMLESYIKKTKYYKKIGAIGCKMVDFDSDPELMPNKYGGQIDLFGFPVSKVERGDIFTISGCPFFISKNTFNKTGGWNENIFLYGEDIDYSWRLKIFGYLNFMEPKTYIFHKGGGATGSFGAEKIAHNIALSLIPILTNYGTTTLFYIMPLYTIYIILINLALLIFKKCDISFNKQVILKFIYLLKKIRKILLFRKYVQNKRVYNDFFILKYLNLIPAFIINKSYEKLSDQYVIKN